MSLAETVIAAMLALAPWHLDKHESPEERRSLYLPVAEAIAYGSGGDWGLAAALVAHGYHESRFARYVVEGRCHDGPPDARCDMGRDGRPRARGPWQVHAWCSVAWAYPDGSPESLRAGARCAARILRLGRARCKTWEGAFAAMHSGGCARPQAVLRAQTFRRVRSGTYR